MGAAAAHTLLSVFTLFQLLGAKSVFGTPYPNCLGCVSAGRILRPAFGVDITASYATSAVRYHNGTVGQLAKVDATQFGRQLYLSETAAYLPGNDQYQHTMQSRREATIADLSQAAAPVLRELRQATFSQFGMHIEEALITLPPFKDSSLGVLVLSEAGRLAGIRLLLDQPGDQRPDTVAAAAAASGIGLCQNFTKLDICSRQEKQMPVSLIYGVEYTQTTLTIAMSPFRASRSGHSFDFTRHWNLGPSNNNGSANYWTEMHKALTSIPGAWPARRITDIILLGDPVLDQKFLEHLQDALWEILPEREDATLGSLRSRDIVNPLYAAALGLAEQAKRELDSPDRCLERSYCDWWRRQIG